MGIIVRKGIVYGGGGSDTVSAQDVEYDNTNSGLTSTDTQGALDELATENSSTKSSITEIESSITGMESSITEMENSLTGIESSITDMEATIAELEEKAVDPSVFEEITDAELDAIIDTDVSDVAMIYTYDTETTYNESEEMINVENVETTGEEA